MSTPHENDPQSRARRARSLARRSPGAVALPPLLPLLSHEDTSVREVALETLRIVACDRAEDCLPALPALQAELDPDDPCCGLALAAVAEIAAECPADVVPSVELLVRHLRTGVSSPTPDVSSPTPDGVSRGASSAGRYRRAAVCHRRALVALTHVAESEPGSLVPHARLLGRLLRSDDPESVVRAVYVLARVSTVDATVLKPFVPDLVALLDHERVPDVVIVNALSTLGRVVTTDPDAVTANVDRVVPLLRRPERRVRANAMAFVSDVGRVAPADLVPLLDDVRERLTDRDDHVRVNATATLARVAETFPDEVRGDADQFVALLDDDSPNVRKNACWALGFLRDETAVDVLDALSRDDPVSDVRERADWALERVEQESS